VLCGGVSALVKSGFETLVEAGYQPEIAYFECLHELKLIVDLMYQGGISYMWYSVSDTAEDGGYLGGDALVTDDVRKRMSGLLGEIRNGGYADRWIRENRDGRRAFTARREAERDHQIEEVGRRLRAMMPFLEARSVPK
jgi:ketol-acid reductoisomerase